LSILEDIEVELSIVLGSAQVQIRQILQMSRGAMIPLDCGQDDPTLVFVNDELIAKGRILVNSEEMSLEVTEITRKSRN
jgi:flagellar motor switch protein FliN/FliY